MDPSYSTSVFLSCTVSVVIYNYVHVAEMVMYTVYIHSTVQTICNAEPHFSFSCVFIVSLLYARFVPLFAFDMTHGQCVALHNEHQILCNQDKLFIQRKRVRAWKNGRDEVKRQFLAFQNVLIRNFTFKYATPARTLFMKYEVLLLW